jgi:hypothetical protein
MATQQPANSTGLPDEGPPQEGEDVRGDFVAVGFVKEFVARVGIDRHGHVLHTGFPIALTHQLNCSTTTGQRVSTPRHQQDRQVRADPRQPLRVGRSQQSRDPAERLRREPAPLVRHIQVHLSSVPAQPLEPGPVLKARIERAQIGRLRAVEHRHQPRHLSRPRQHHRIDVTRVVDQELLGRERPHRVPKQHQRQLRVIGPDPRVEPRHIVDPPRPRVLAPMPKPPLRRPPRPTPVRRIDEIPNFGQRPRKSLVAQRMLTQTVLDLHHRARLTIGRPAIDLQLYAVPASDLDRRLVHAPRACHAPLHPSTANPPHKHPPNRQAHPACRALPG